MELRWIGYPDSLAGARRPDRRRQGLPRDSGFRRGSPRRKPRCDANHLTNRRLQLTAGRPDVPNHIMKTRPLQSTLALARGS